MKKEIEDRLIANERILQLWTAEDALDETKQKHFKVKTNKTKIDSAYDVDEVTVELRSNTRMSTEVQLVTIMEAMKQLEADPLIRKVIHQSHSLVESADEATHKKQGEVNFIIISAIDK